MTCTSKRKLQFLLIIASALIVCHIIKEIFELGKSKDEKGTNISYNRVQTKQIAEIQGVVVNDEEEEEKPISVNLNLPKIENATGDNLDFVESSVSGVRDNTTSSADDASALRKSLLEQGMTPILPYWNSTSSTNVTGNLTEWEYNLFERLDRIQLKCGELCQINSVPEIVKHSVVSNGSLFAPIIVPNVNCKAILEMEEIDAGDMTFPPLIPKQLEKFYTLSGAYRIRQGKDKVRKDAYLEGEAEKSLWKTGNIWEEKDIDDAIEQIHEKKLAGPYGLEETIELTEDLSQYDMKDKSVLVIGSSHPWVEVICLYHGVKKVTTLEYGEIISLHPQIETETPKSFREKYFNGELELFDGIVTQSSIEHSGLGRYGDALNPWGDILAIARAWCVTKPNAFMWLSVPTGKDFVFYNWHRVYGRIRWPLLTINWKQIGQTKGFNPDETFDLGVWKSMENNGFMFEKLDPTTYDVSMD